VSYKLPPDSNGIASSAFEFLSLHIAELQQLKFSRFDDEGNKVDTIDLVLSSAGRGLRSGPFCAPASDDATGDQQTKINNEIAAALKEVASLAKQIVSALRDRLSPPETESRWLSYMRMCLDLRKMASDPAYSQRRSLTEPVGCEFALLELYKWMQLRFVFGEDRLTATETFESAYQPMPAFSGLWDQYQLLCKRLLEARQEPLFARVWANASGVVIMKVIFTEPRFYKGCEDFLYLFQHMATKVMNEAVLEGMGSVWDRAAQPGRHPSFAEGVKEAVIAWNAPPQWHPAAEKFITRALNHHFGGASWNFTHNDRRQRAPEWASRGQSKVTTRLYKQQARLPTSVYDVAPPRRQAP
jgi:hypothetical protein